MNDSKTQPAVQWWLVRLGPHGNPTLSDGPHDDRVGAEQALYLLNRLGLSKDRRYAVARIEMTEAVPNPKGANETALCALNEMGLKPRSTKWG